MVVISHSQVLVTITIEIAHRDWVRRAPGKLGLGVEADRITRCWRCHGQGELFWRGWWKLEAFWRNARLIILGGLSGHWHAYCEQNCNGGDGATPKDGLNGRSAGEFWLRRFHEALFVWCRAKTHERSRPKTHYPLLTHRWVRPIQMVFNKFNGKKATFF